MKPATGKYKGVKPLTRSEAIALASEIFGNPAWVRLYRAVEEWNRTRKECVHVREEWCRAREEWCRAVEQLGGYSPDWRAINFITADRPNGVYSFVNGTTRGKEIWFYDGETCPDARTVEVVWVEG